MPAKALPPPPQLDLLTFDSLVHACLFGGLVLLALLGFHRDPGLTLTKGIIFGILLTSIVFGIVIELLQGAMSFGRSAEISDVLSNGIGSVLGLLIWPLVARRF